MRSAIAIVLLGLTACSGDHGGDAESAPAAPTGLVASELAGGAHLVWTDNSDNEEHFMIMRREDGGEYVEVDMVDFDTTSYHDTAVTAGTTYTYQVWSMNSKGEGMSNEVTFAF